MSDLVPVEIIANKIFLIRGQKVMLDRDLAMLYGVTTGNLNKAVSRNLDRFPDDFMLQLTKDESNSLRFQFGSLKRGRYVKYLPYAFTEQGVDVKYLPYAFTEQGVAMLSSVLRSKRAVRINISIMRAFVRIREYLATHKDVLKKLEEHDRQIKTIFEVINKMLLPPKPKKTGKIGF